MGKGTCVKRTLDLVTLYLADGGSRERSDALKNDVRGEDRGNLTAGGFEVSLDSMADSSLWVLNLSGEERFSRSMRISDSSCMLLQPSKQIRRPVDEHVPSPLSK